jgi:CheY-like chemotaxis protein
MNFTILVVEDDAALRASIVRLLQRNFRERGDVTVCQAESYDQARTQYEQAGDDLQFIVSDFQYSGKADMEKPNPKGDGGLDFYEFCQTRESTAGFVFHSGTDSPTIQTKIAERGLPAIPAEHILAKPMGTQSMIPLIQQRLAVWDARDAGPDELKARSGTVKAEAAFNAA